MVLTNSVSYEFHCSIECMFNHCLVDPIMSARSEWTFKMSSRRLAYDPMRSYKHFIVLSDILSHVLPTLC